MSLSPTTELEAVNLMLSKIGEAPVNSLSGLQVADALLARTILAETSREVQSWGWHFNLERNYELTPDTLTQELFLPLNCLRVDYQRDNTIDIAQRGNRLYDRRHRTYQFTQPLKVDLVLLLSFEDLPESARHYIVIRAGRKFQDRTLGSNTLHGWHEQDELMAKAALEDAEGDNADHSIFNHYDVARIVDRWL